MKRRHFSVEGVGAPDLRYVIPGWGENRWSDLLATLLATDPQPLGPFIDGAVFDEVLREVVPPDATASKDRLDLLLRRGGVDVAAIEVKVLSDFGLDQLTRYETSFPAPTAYRVLHLHRLPVNPEQRRWQTITWEQVLRAYSKSRNPWVATTARAWLDQLDSLIPVVTKKTVWNDVPDDVAGFELALRARIAWLLHHLRLTQLRSDVAQSSGGGQWVLRLWRQTGAEPEGDGPHFRVQVEVQEGLGAYEWRPHDTIPYRDRLRGPAPLVGLRMFHVDSSEEFDWQLLRRLFAEHALDRRGNPGPEHPWQLSPARPRHETDRKGWSAMVAAGGPPWLGKGFGMAVAKQHYRECLFGARLQYPPDATLGDIRDRLEHLEPLVVAMAETVDTRR